MPEWLSGNEWAAWLGLAFVLGVVEAATADLVFLMLAGGAVAASIGAAFQLPLAVQAILAVVVAAALLVVVRPLAKKRLNSGADLTQIGTGRYIGRVGVVTEQVGEHAGLVRVEGEVWSSRLDNAADGFIPAGHEVKVTEVRGATLIVTPVPPVRDIITRGK